MVKDMHKTYFLNHKMNGNNANYKTCFFKKIVSELLSLKQLDCAEKTQHPNQ